MVAFYYYVCEYLFIVLGQPVWNCLKSSFCLEVIFSRFNSYSDHILRMLLSFSWLCALWFDSNADQASWWELMALGSHVHPSVAAMARTLLSGANIVYNGNPLNDLSLTSFLDKFMEKKPKQSTWHGASQIEPAKKVSHLQASYLAM